MARQRRPKTRDSRAGLSAAAEPVEDQYSVSRRLWSHGVAFGPFFTFEFRPFEAAALADVPAISAYLHSKFEPVRVPMRFSENSLNRRHSH